MHMFYIREGHCYVFGIQSYCHVIHFNYHTTLFCGTHLKPFEGAMVSTWCMLAYLLFELHHFISYWINHLHNCRELNVRQIFFVFLFIPITDAVEIYTYIFMYIYVIYSICTVTESTLYTYKYSTRTILQLL